MLAISSSPIPVRCGRRQSLRIVLRISFAAVRLIAGPNVVKSLPALFFATLGWNVNPRKSNDLATLEGLFDRQHTTRVFCGCS